MEILKERGKSKAGSSKKRRLSKRGISVNANCDEFARALKGDAFDVNLQLAGMHHAVQNRERSASYLQPCAKLLESIYIT